MISFVFLFSLLGFMALSLAMKRHFLQVQPQATKPISFSTRKALLLRVLGSVFLILAAYLCIYDHGVSVGLVFWLGLMTIAALAHSLLLTYRPNWVVGVGLSSLLLVFVNGVVG